VDRSKNHRPKAKTVKPNAVRSQDRGKKRRYKAIWSAWAYGPANKTAPSASDQSVKIRSIECEGPARKPRPARPRPIKNPPAPRPRSPGGRGRAGCGRCRPGAPRSRSGVLELGAHDVEASIAALLAAWGGIAARLCRRRLGSCHCDTQSAIGCRPGQPGKPADASRTQNIVCHQT
jgi:hypothetical protein